MEINLATAIPRFRTHLCLGRPGTGKTRLLGTFPKPIYMFCYDDGWDTLAMIEGITCNVLDLSVSSESPELTTLKVLDNIKNMEYTWKDGKKEKYQTIAFDPYSFYSKWLYDADPPESINEWGIFGEKLMKPLIWAKGTGKYVYVSCHTQFRELQTKKTIVKGDKTGGVSTGEFAWLPMIHTTQRENFAAWFDACFMINRVGMGDATLDFIPMAKKELKVRYCFHLDGLLGNGEPANFMKLKEKFDKKINEIQLKRGVDQ